jgi:uncharacterized protein involved in exopolysaccharide biosynthesis
MRQSLPPGQNEADLLPFDEEAGARIGSRSSALDWARLLLHATWRRKWVFAGAFLVSMSAVAAYFIAAPRLYRTEATVLAQRQQALPTVVRQGAADDAPTRTAYELIHSKENLRALLRSAGLLDEKAAPPSLSERLLGTLGLVANVPEQDPGGPLVRHLDG